MKTEQPPFFPFWAKDWITSEATRLMSLAARGAYADLLAIAWLSSDEPCTLPDDDASIARLLSVPLREWKSVAGVVRQQFALTPSGRLRNARLWEVYCEVQAKRDKMSRGGRKGAEQRWGGDEPPNGEANGEANRVAIMPPLATKAKAKGRVKATTSVAAAPGRKARPSGTDPRRALWLEASKEAYERSFGVGSFPYGEAGKHLKPLHDAGNTPDMLAEHLTRYLAKTDAQFVSLSRFAKTFDAHARLRFTEPPVDEDGCMSAEFERLTRPPGVYAT